MNSDGPPSLIADIEMRALSQDESALLARRRNRLPDLLAEKGPVLVDFAERLELQDPAMIAIEPSRYVPSISRWMRDQVVSSEDRVWIVTRLGYLIGELLIQRLGGGQWFIDEIPDSRYFLDYVVGRFPGINPAAMVNPFYAADDLVATPSPRDLEALLCIIERELRAA